MPPEQSSDAFLKKWLNQDVAYIASEAEKAAYLSLLTGQTSGAMNSLSGSGNNGIRLRGR